MTAVFLRTVLAVWLIASGGWLAFFLGRGSAAVAVFGCLGILGFHGFVLGIEFVLLRVVDRGRHDRSPTWRELARAWLREVKTATIVFGWQQAFHAAEEANCMPTQPEGRPGFLLVHGFLCNRGLWNPWMQAFRNQGIPFLALDLEPPFASIDEYVAAVDRGVGQLWSATGRAPIVVGHSMGGLAIRAWLAERGDACKILQAVTVATPHHGSWIARFGLARNSRQMCPGSAWLAALARREHPTDAGRFICFYSDCDNVAFPTATGALAGARNRLVRGAAHVDLLYRPEVMAEVLSLERAARSS